jgi:hypothetical protein
MRGELLVRTAHQRWSSSTTKAAVNPCMLPIDPHEPIAEQALRG